MTNAHQHHLRLLRNRSEGRRRGRFERHGDGIGAKTPKSVSFFRAKNGIHKRSAVGSNSEIGSLAYRSRVTPVPATECGVIKNKLNALRGGLWVVRYLPALVRCGQAGDRVYLTINAM